ncbi:MAG: hypothetical protein AB7G34_00600 [Hyphomicrobiales bacterium]
MGLPAKFARMFMRISAGVWLAALLATGAPPSASSAEGKKANPAKPPEILMRDAALPAPVARMRDAILEAARGGDIEAMRPVLESNELRPVVSFGGGQDAIRYWKENSATGDGREILAAMIEVLEMPAAHVHAGAPEEMYVWPYLAELELEKLTPAQQVDLYRLVTPETAKTMKDFGGYIHYRLGIGRDGTWHFFVAGD